VTRSGFARQKATRTPLAFDNAEVLRLTEPRSGREPGDDAVRAQLDLSDLFENFARNHGNYYLRGAKMLVAKTH